MVCRSPHGEHGPLGTWAPGHCLLEMSDLAHQIPNFILSIRNYVHRVLVNNKNNVKRYLAHDIWVPEPLSHQEHGVKTQETSDHCMILSASFPSKMHGHVQRKPTHILGRILNLLKSLQHLEPHRQQWLIRTVHGPTQHTP